jgi:organizing structure protein 2
MHHFLPQTTSNISAYLNSLEQEYFPSVAEKHQIGRAHAKMTLERVKEWTREGREGVGRSMEGAVERVQGLTGLKLREGLGWGKRFEGKVVEAVNAAEETMVKKLEAGKRVAEAKVDEAK